MSGDIVSGGAKQFVQRHGVGDVEPTACRFGSSEVPATNLDETHEPEAPWTPRSAMALDKRAKWVRAIAHQGYSGSLPRHPQFPIQLKTPRQRGRCPGKTKLRGQTLSRPPDSSPLGWAPGNNPAYPRCQESNRRRHPEDAPGQGAGIQRS